MHRLFSSVCLLLSITLLGQQETIDSLVVQINNYPNKDSVRVRLMNDLAYAYRSTNPDSSLSIGNRALELANKLNLTYEKAWTLNRISSAYWMKADYPQVLRFAHEALDIFQEIEDNEGIAQSYNTLANTYNMQGEHSNSLEYYKKTIDIYTKLDDQFNIARAYANIGRTYFMIGEYSEALENLQMVIEDYKDTPENMLYPIVLNTQGDVYQAQDQLDKALENYMKALEITERLKIPRVITYSTRGISEVYQKKGNLIKSNEYAIKTLSISKDIGYLENIKNAALIISNNNKKLGNFKEALDYYSQYTAAKDSMFNRDKEHEITKLKESYEISQKQKEIQLLQIEAVLQKENTKNQKVLLYGVILIGFLAIIIGIVQYRKSQLKQKTNKRLSKLNSDIQSQKNQLEETKSELEQAVETKNKFFAIISHDLKNLASQFSAVTYLMNDSLKENKIEDMEKLVGMAKDSSQKMTRLLDNLLNWALQKNNYFPYAPERINIAILINDIVDLFASQLSGKKINIVNLVDEAHASYVDKNSMMTVFRNLLSNAIKFTAEGKSITIRSDLSDNYVNITFTDEGVGIEEEKLDTLFTMHEGKSTVGTSGEEGFGLGLKLVYDFVELNKGSIQVESKVGQGTTFKVSIPEG